MANDLINITQTAEDIGNKVIRIGSKTTLVFRWSFLLCLSTIAYWPEYKLLQLFQLVDTINLLLYEGF